MENYETERYFEEPPYAREKLEKGEFAVGYFHGQTILFIPKSIGITLETIQKMAESIFGKDELEDFAGLSGDAFELSYTMELPPQTNMEDNLVIDLKDAIIRSYGSGTHNPIKINVS